MVSGTKGNDLCVMGNHGEWLGNTINSQFYVQSVSNQANFSAHTKTDSTFLRLCDDRAVRLGMGWEGEDTEDSEEAHQNRSSALDKFVISSAFFSRNIPTLKDVTLKE